MRITYRNKSTKAYWTERWTTIKTDEPMTNTNIYPLKYALQGISYMKKNGKILEAGCGNGRILRYLHQKKYDIIGIDYIPECIEKIKKETDCIAETGDILNLHYKDESFDLILAFGLYHGLQENLHNQAFSETQRILKKNGILVCSFRADSIATRISDWKRERERERERERN